MFSIRNYFQIGVLSFVFFTLPLAPKITPILITLSIVLSFFSKTKLNFKKLPIVFYFFPIFYVLHLLSFFYSENVSFLFRDLETKLSFIIIPLIFFKESKLLYDRKKIVSIAFLLGIITSSVLSYIQAYDCYELAKTRHCFEASQMAYVFHPTYLSLYYIVGIIVYWTVIYDKKYKWILSILGGVLTCYLLYFIYQLYSAGPIIAGIFMLLSMVTTFFVFRKKFILFILTIAVLILGLFFSVNKFELLESDYNAIKNELTDYKNDPAEYIQQNKNNTQSIKARIVIWTLSVSLINEHKFGVGGGDVKDVLINSYKENELDAYAEQKLNNHNQYFQTMLALGIHTGILLLVSLIMFWWIGMRNGKYLLVSVSSLLLISMLFESILEQQGGTLFFIIFLYFSFNIYLFESKKHEFP